MRHYTLKICLLISLAIITCVADIHAATIKNTKIYQQNNQLLVEYDLDADKDSEISAVLSINKKLYAPNELHLEGDINKSVESGKQRKIIWNIQKDFPQGYKGEILLKLIPIRNTLSESKLLPDVLKKQNLYKKIENDGLATTDNINSIKLDSSLSGLVSKFDEAITNSYVDEISPQQLSNMKLFCAKFKDIIKADHQIDDQTFTQLLSTSVAISNDDAEKYFSCILGLLDPHSSFMSSDTYKEMKMDTKGAFSGVGLEITIKDEVITVISPIENSPAFKAGIKSGDQILKVDEKQTKNLSVNDAVKRIRGKRGSSVDLTIMREGFVTPKLFSVVRDIIQVKSVSSRLLKSGYGYIRIAQFQENTNERFGKALELLEEENKGPISGLILDLRNDPGGLLDQAVKVADHFINDGLIVYTHGRNKESKIQFPAKKGNKEPNYPMAVLINEGSASASEIVSGALQDYKRATVIGTQSFGKGTVQTIVPLPDETAMRLTTAKYYTPLGRSIQAKGITPDIVVERALINDDAIITFAEHLKMKAKGSTDPVRLAEIASQVKADNFLLLFSDAVKTDVDIISTGNEPSHIAQKRPTTVPQASLGAKPPTILIRSPDIQRSLKVVEKSSSITVIGTANSDIGISDVNINGNQATLDEQGNFSAKLLLKIGENQVTVVATDIKGSDTTKTFNISRLQGGAVAQSQLPVQEARGIETGKYYALLIAVQDYSSPDINKLDYPISDATKLKNVFTQKYNFEAKNVTFLKNPDRKGISKAFNDLRGRLTERDNLVVFYAGHGVWMDDMREGYWLPRDASGVNDPSDWIPNSTIRNYIRALKAKHVLLVADACFSGGIFKVRDAFNITNASIEKIYEMPSRKAITSGSLKTVPDRSVFVEYLIKRLSDNPDKYLDAQKLFVSFKEAVINNSPNNQTPLYGAINETGDEGGDFVFVRK